MTYYFLSNCVYNGLINQLIIIIIFNKLRMD